MGKMYSFNKSVRGYSHIQRDISCEDASASYEAPNGAYHIIAVADGHGDPACFRSDRGSAFAVKAALDCLKAFAEEKLSLPASNRERFFRDMFSNERYRTINMRQLTDKVVDSWLGQILQDLENDPPTPEQMADMYAVLQARYQTDNININKAYIYGSTLMAGLWLPDALFLIHHGDGRCDVFYGDGSINQPIPWDKRCEGNMTTSLCQPDAKDSFRHCVLDLGRQEVTACYLGSDGVEDAYRDTYSDLGGSHTLMGGVHTFYKRLSVEAVRRTKDDMERYLEDTLPGFSERGLYSKSGSGDDVSVAGLILRPERLAYYVPQFILDCKRYYLEENLFWMNHDIGSKTRKHGVLQRRISSMEEERKEAEQEKVSLGAQLEGLKQDVNDQTVVVQQAEQSVSESKREKTIVRNGVEDIRGNGSLMEFFALILKLAGTSLSTIKETIMANCNKQEKYYQKQLQILDDKRQACQRIEDELQRCDEFLSGLGEQLEAAKQEFTEYDNKYRTLEMARNNVELQIEDLSRGVPVTIPELELDFSPQEPEERRPVEESDVETTDEPASDTETHNEPPSDTETHNEPPSEVETHNEPASDTETHNETASDTETPDEPTSDTGTTDETASDTGTTDETASDTGTTDEPTSDTKTHNKTASEAETTDETASGTETTDETASEAETTDETASNDEK